MWFLLQFDFDKLYCFSDKVFFDVFSAWKISFRELYSSMGRCVSWAFWQKINFLFSMDLLVVIICCSRNCLIKENMKFFNVCCLFAKLAVTLESVAIAFANSSCCVCNSVTWSPTWFNCNVDRLFKSSNLSLTYHYMFSFELGLCYLLMHLLG